MPGSGWGHWHYLLGMWPQEKQTTEIRRIKCSVHFLYSYIESWSEWKATLPTNLAYSKLLSHSYIFAGSHQQTFNYLTNEKLAYQLHSPCPILTCIYVCTHTELRRAYTDHCYPCIEVESSILKSVAIGSKYDASLVYVHVHAMFVATAVVNITLTTVIRGDHASVRTNESTYTWLNRYDWPSSRLRMQRCGGLVRIEHI